MGVKMPYPTKRRRAPRRQKTAGDGRQATIAERRVNPPPQIYVRVEGSHSWRESYARAHLRIRKGYVYLAWRDGGRVREFYIGKAPRKSPTENAGTPGAGAAAGELVDGLGCRVKTKAPGSPAAVEKPAGRRFSSRS